MNMFIKCTTVDYVIVVLFSIEIIAWITKKNNYVLILIL